MLRLAPRVTDLRERFGGMTKCENCPRSVWISMRKITIDQRTKQVSLKSNDPIASEPSLWTKLFQQDSATSHTTRETMGIVQQDFLGHLISGGMYSPILRTLQILNQQRWRPAVDFWKTECLVILHRHIFRAYKKIVCCITSTWRHSKYETFTG
jgi:hypothetical protein